MKYNIVSLTKQITYKLEIKTRTYCTFYQLISGKHKLVPPRQIFNLSLHVKVLKGVASEIRRKCSAKLQRRQPLDEDKALPHHKSIDL